MEIWPRDPWALFSRKAGLIYALCILVGLAIYGYGNRIAPVAATVSLLVVALVFSAFLLLAGTSKLTWADPANAVALLLIALAFLADGIFIAGASIFGPVRVLDVGVTDSLANPIDAYFWLDSDVWLRAKLPPNMSEEEYREFLEWAGDLALTNRLDLRPGRIEISTWDRQVYRLEMKNARPPRTIGGSPHVKPRSFVELFCGLTMLICSARVWRLR